MTDRKPTLGQEDWTKLERKFENEQLKKLPQSTMNSTQLWPVPTTEQWEEQLAHVERMRKKGMKRVRKYRVYQKKSE